MSDDALFGDMAELYLALLPEPLTAEDAAEATGLTAERVAAIATDPVNRAFLRTTTDDDELRFRVRFGWLVVRIAGEARLPRRDHQPLMTRLSEALPDHVDRYWRVDGRVTRDLGERSLYRWLANEIYFLSGFALWFSEYAEGEQVNVSMFASAALGQEVAATGTLDFDRERLKLVEPLAPRLLRRLRDASPAGKLAYRSLELAVVSGLAQGDGDDAETMRRKTRKRWWRRR